jgi:glucose-1-phosphate thymidylyltransferase
MTASANFTKGIVLAGGAGKRLHPATKVVSKQLLPVYDKPMVYYPLSTLILAGIRDVLLISTPQDIGLFERLFEDGSQVGLKIHSAVQPRPEGIAQAFHIGRDFVADDHVALILGDNIFSGVNFEQLLVQAATRHQGATIFAKSMADPCRYGVIELDERGRPQSILEKPTITQSRLAVTGLYFYDNQVIEIAARLRPSERRELEITDVNRAYLQRGQLSVLSLDAESAWFDAGTHDSYLAATVYVDMVQSERGSLIGSIEEAAYRRGLISADQLLILSEQCDNNYGHYLHNIASQSLRSRPDR